MVLQFCSTISIPPFTPFGRNVGAITAMVEFFNLIMYLVVPDGTWGLAQHIDGRIELDIFVENHDFAF